jgi:hypothetical protein
MSASSVRCSALGEAARNSLFAAFDLQDVNGSHASDF